MGKSVKRKSGRDNALLRAAVKIHGDPSVAVGRVRSRLPHLKRLGMQVITEIETGWRR